MIQKLVSPAAYVMSRLDLSRKLVLLGILALSPLFILTYNVTQQYPQTFSSTGLIVFVSGSSTLFIYFLLGQYFEANNAFVNASRQYSKMNLSLFHQEYLPLLKLIHQEKVLAQRKLDQVMAAVSEVSSAAEMLVGLAENSAAGSHQQGEAVNSIASAIEQMSASLGQVEERSAATQLSSTQSSQLAIEGESVTQQAVQDMQSIANSVNESSTLILSLGERSQQIDSIIHVIESISEQTNLLALNAAIEAARAGEHGRGFAVVADEVRSLATRSHDAAAEVAEQIQKIQTEIQRTVQAMDKVTSSVENGVELINRSSETLQNIKQGAQQTANMFTGINAAITEQGDVSKSIASNIEQINHQAQQHNHIIDNVESSAEYLVTLAKQARDISA